MIKNIVRTLLVLALTICAQDENKVHEFKLITKVPATEIKSQDKTGTCWSFATASFLESELLRMDKGKYDLSEMFMVRNAWNFKTEKYFRYHGTYNIFMGGQAHDFLIEYAEHGAIPESIYSGKINGEVKHNHKEMDAIIKSVMSTVVSKKSLQSKPVWLNIIEATLDSYLGKVPESFEYEGVKYTPKEFGRSLGIDINDYVELTSYTHHPFYDAIELEIPDNYRGEKYYNIPLDEFMSVIDNAINNGYSLVWDGSVSKDNFFSKKGYGAVPVEDWDSKSKKPEVEEKIDQDYRQKYFDSYEVIDDHLVHMVGIAENQEGTKFYYIKNSWGTKDKGFDGYYYFSEEYVKLRTIAIMVHKDAIPMAIKLKLDL